MIKNVLILGEIEINSFKDYNLNFYNNKDVNYEKIDYIFIRGSNFDLSKNILQKYKNLSKIFVFGIGMDNIDLEYCKNNNILVRNCKTSSIDSVSELSLMMLINGLRHGTLLSNILFGGKYYRKPIGNQLIGNKKLKIGIVGFGNIGKNTAKLLQTLNVENILIYDRNYQSIDKIYYNGFTFFDNEENFYNEIDILILHINYDNSNLNLINYDKIKNSKIQIIINTSRKEIVNEDDIIKLLNDSSCELNHYGTDVLIGEPKIENINKKLLTHPKVFVTPHIGANTKEAQENIYNEIKKYLIN